MIPYRQHPNISNKMCKPHIYLKNNKIRVVELEASEQTFPAIASLHTLERDANVVSSDHCNPGKQIVWNVKQLPWNQVGGKKCARKATRKSTRKNTRKTTRKATRKATRKTTRKATRKLM